MLNCAIVMGRLTSDPELRQTPSSVAVTRFTVAVDRGYVKQGEERKTDFITIVAWRQTAEFVCKYFKKGSMIAVRGAIQTGTYEKDGRKNYTFEIVADYVSFCGSKNESGTNSSTMPNLSNCTAEAFAAMADDDDLPF